MVQRQYPGSARQTTGFRIGLGGPPPLEVGKAMIVADSIIIFVASAVRTSWGAIAERMSSSRIPQMDRSGWPMQLPGHVDLRPEQLGKPDLRTVETLKLNGAATLYTDCASTAAPVERFVKWELWSVIQRPYRRNSEPSYRSQEVATAHIVQQPCLTGDEPCHVEDPSFDRSRGNGEVCHCV